MEPNITWTCHACGMLRHDEKISVVSRSVHLPHGGEIQRNVRYCNDKAECLNRATRSAEEYVRNYTERLGESRVGAAQ